MKVFSILLGSTIIIFFADVGVAVLFYEDFNYSNGMLKNVSGGVWDTWLGTSQDAIVASGMLVLDSINMPDVVTYYPSALQGIVPMISTFSFLVHEEGQTDSVSYLWIGGGTEATKEIDYNLWGFIVDLGHSIGSTELHLWDVDGDNGGGNWGIASLANGLALDTWHTVVLFALQTVANPLGNSNVAADGKFQVFLNGELVMDWTNFGNNSPNGVNSIEIYSVDDGNEHNFFAYDKIMPSEAIPEPNLLVLTGLGFLMLVSRRK